MPIKLIPTKTNIAFINKKAICMALSLLVIIGTVALVATKGINFGIDFTGGIIIEAKTDSKVALADIRSALGQNVSLQRVDDLGEIMIRLPSDPNRENQEIITEVKAKLAAVIEGKIDYRRIDYVGPQVGNELIETAIIALLASFGAMLIYIWFRFEWQYGVGAILALVHDAIAVIGFYVVTQMEFNLSSVAAV
ncbi:MAG: protein translocase subunit SecF, partial [Alphaproteobacteria bacterium CG11_big_fil_rev_8_21_14_0_20_44_7]